MANLVIDIGNTQTKLAVFNSDELLWFEPVTHIDQDGINNILIKHGVKKAIVASVQGNMPDFFKSSSVVIRQFNNQMVRSINNYYQTPLTLGADRLAAVVGAAAVNDGKDTLVIDAGTCITYDLVDAGRNYYGGSISPGLTMRYKAVNHYTAALPLLETDHDFDGSFGKNTSAAITSGVQNGFKYEIEGFIQYYKKQYPDLSIILTGGDGIFLDTLLKNSIFAPYIKNDPYLVLRGLNAVIKEYND